MSVLQIRPEDVPPAEVRRILDFLNTAETAAEIDARIDLPNEPDIGPRLAAHIVERRTELGSFTSLDQLLTVNLIGPVRFARIVRSLAGDLSGPVSRGEFEKLVDELGALRALIETLHATVAPPRVELGAIEPQRYLGQPLTLVAAVSGSDGLRLADVPVTLTASWGRLRGADGFSVEEGSSVTLRTSGDGTARVTLHPPTSEDLQDTQQAAVELELRRLDPSSETPRDDAEALAALVRAYRFEANDDFRNGVDIYFRDFHQHLLDRVNYRDELDDWATFDCAVVAYVQELPEAPAADADTPIGAPVAPRTPVRAAAALVVRFRDWLGPWLQAHVSSTGEETLLGGELKLAANLPEPDDVLSRIHQRVGDFVSLQQGLVGQIVAQKVAEAKVDSFLQTDLDSLPAVAQQALFPGAASASSTIGTLGVQALGAIQQTRADLRKNVSKQIMAGVGSALEGSAAFAGLQEAVAAKVDQSAFDAALAAKLDIADLNDKLTAAESFDGFKTSLTSVLNVRLLQPPGGFFQP